MKKFQLFILCTLAVSTAIAQTKTVKPSVNQANRQINNKERLQANTPPTEALPDLRIVSLTVKYEGDETAGSEVRRKLSISYTIRNEGTAAADPGAFSTQGFLSNGMPGCGGGVNMPGGKKLEPGAEASGNFSCSAKLDKTGAPVYTLKVDYGNRVKESNEQNNSAQQTIVF
ncbi:hypothetical protein JMG10_05425 [Nostoc ellipsosporum NOK]|nr:hypothetical protein [Nostoc ellipsosporum NOK]